MEVEKREQLVIKSNTLIGSRYELTLSEMRIILHMITMINKDDEDFKEYRIKIKDFVDIIDTKGKNEYKRAKEITKKLRQRTLELPKENGFIQIGWISKAEYYYGKGYVDIRFEPELKPYMLQLKEKFTRYNIKNILSLKSIYHIRIYELLKQYENIKYRILDVDELRYILGITNKQYQKYNDFKKRVIIPAQEELKTYCDIYFTYEEIKDSRKVVKIKFTIHKNNKAERNILQETSVQMHSETDKNITTLIQKLREDYRDKLTVTRILQQYLDTNGYDYVLRNIEYANKNSKKDYRTYLQKTLENDWGLTLFEDDEILQTARKKQKEADSIKQQEQQEREKRDSILQKVTEYYTTLGDEERKRIQTYVFTMLDYNRQVEIEDNPFGSKLLELEVQEYLFNKFSESD